MATDSNRILVRESEWMRVYQFNDGTLMYESKFLVDNLVVKADAIKRRWITLSSDERLEFAQAFQVKPEITPEDDLVLEFLMETGDTPIWITIAPLLARYPDHARSVAFLAQRIREPGRGKANYYQALELINDREALAVLFEAYEAYQPRLHDLVEPSEVSEIEDFLSCCRALWKMDGSTKYRQILQDFARSNDRRLGLTAQHLLQRP
jgi:hypothetical protein